MFITINNTHKIGVYKLNGEQLNQKSIVIAPKEKEETRSKRVNLLLKPSLYEKAQEKCKNTGVSMNECIHQLLEIWIQQ